MTRQRKMLISLAALYAAMMVYLLFFREPAFTDEPYWGQVQAHFNPVPFRTISLYLGLLERPSRPWLIRLARVNLWGNILLFLPLGLLPPLLQPKLRSLWKTLLLAALVMVTVEVLQMLLLVGTCDVDDLILNLLGTALGYGFFKRSHRKNLG